MKLYLYKIGETVPILEIESVMSYTADQVVTTDGTIYEPLADDCELSSSPDCSETLRYDWRKSQGPSTEKRVSDLEEQLVQADETAIALYESQQEQETINAQQDEALMEIYEMLG